MKTIEHHRPMTVGTLMSILSTLDPELFVVGERLDNHWHITILPGNSGILLLEGDKLFSKGTKY